MDMLKSLDCGYNQLLSKIGVSITPLHIEQCTHPKTWILEILKEELRIVTLRGRISFLYFLIFSEIGIIRLFLYLS